MNLGLTAVSKKDFMSSAMALSFILYILRPPCFLLLYRISSSGFSNWSLYTQDFIEDVIADESRARRSMEAHLNQSLDEQ